MSAVKILDVKTAAERLRPFVHVTPLLRSSLLDEWLGNKVVFKVEAFQKTGSFKIRGALNAMLILKEKGYNGDVVAFSSGNHAQGVAAAAELLGMKATIILPKNAAANKIAATKSYGADVIIAEDRATAEKICAEMAAAGAELIHPFDNEDVMAGQGTSCYEVLQTGLKPDYIFATVGGGGWLSGTYSAAKQFGSVSEIWAAEPLLANDAATSCRNGKITRMDDAYKTIADGARTPQIGELTFPYLKALNGFVEVAEEDIIYWTQWVSHLLKFTCEPTSAVAMAAAFSHMKKHRISGAEYLIMVSGGNISPESRRVIWQKSCLDNPPAITV